MNTIELNINNLTALWKSACQPFNSYNRKEGIEYCSIPNSNWPNRIWTKEKITKENIVKISEIIQNYKTELVFSFFNQNSSNEEDLILKNGYSENFSQYGMSLKLDNTFNTNYLLEFKKVTTLKESENWCIAFKEAFGYIISSETVFKNCSKIDYFIIYHQDQIVGTILYYITNNTIGIHSLGIIPSMRKKGYAQDIMSHILNRGLDLGIPLATLQASKMAKSMYEKLGFTTAFIVQNFKLNSN